MWISKSKTMTFTLMNSYYTQTRLALSTTCQRKFTKLLNGCLVCFRIHVLTISRIKTLFYIGHFAGWSCTTSYKQCHITTRARQENSKRREYPRFTTIVLNFNPEIIFHGYTIRIGALIVDLDGLNSQQTSKLVIGKACLEYLNPVNHTSR